MFRRCLVSVSLLIAVGFCVWPRADAAEPPAKTAQAWTLDEALTQLKFNPEDVYLQYVALQLAHNEGRAGEVAKQIDTLNNRRPWAGRRDSRRQDLFDLFTGASAVQESLQLDTMDDGQGASFLGLASPDANTVRISDLGGPSVTSHPWGKMLAASQLAGKKPEIGPLDLCVPEDQYYVVFRSLTKLLDGIDAGDIWGSHLFNQAAKCAKTQRASDRLKAQLAIQTDPLTRPFYDMFVDEVAATGSDVFFREGSDVTMLFRVKQPELFRLRMDGFLEAAAKSRGDAVRSTGRIGSVDYVSVTTPDRAIHVFSAYPRPDLHVRSNSKAALERVLAAVAGEKNVPRLGESAEFRYIRTLMPRGAKEEDGLIYLSDPFIRRLVGPELKLTERRRLICYNHLRMIGHAAMLYRTQYGKLPGSLDELVSSGCAWAFGDDATVVNHHAAECPCGGKYSLAPDGMTGVCSHHGNALELVPCREIALEKVTPGEARQYEQFVTEYSQYWRRYFDPIAIRVQVSPKQYRAETIILPLIDNSVYTQMAMAFGGEPEPLDALPVPQRNIFSVAVRVNKEELLKHDRPTYGLFHELTSQGLPQRPGAISVEEFMVKGLGNQIGMHIYDASPMFDFDLTRFLGEMLGEFRGVGSGFRNEMLPISFLIASLNSPVYLAIPVRDEKIVDTFFNDLDDTLAALARRKEGGGWFGIDYDFYHVTSPQKGRHTRCYAFRFGPIKWRMFFERIEGGLYIASKRCILDDLAAELKNPSRPAADVGPAAHAMVRVRAEHWKQVMPEYQLGWAEGSREACLSNLASLGPVARALTASGVNPVKPADIDRVAGKLYGVHSFCPDGGKYEVQPDGRSVRCSLHGTLMAPRQRIAPSLSSPMGQVLKDFGGLTAALTFLEDGLHAVVTIERKSGQDASPAAAGAKDQPPAHSASPLPKKPVDAGDYYIIANSLARRQKFEEAIQNYQRALELSPDHARSHNGLALALVSRKRYDEALAHYRKALQLKPDYAEVHFNIGDYHRTVSSDKDKAIESYRKALAIKPEYAEAHHNLGFVLIALGRTEEATAEYQKALKIKPDSAEAHNALGSLLAAQGRFKEAIEHFLRATGIKWDYLEARLNLAKCYARLGRPKDAAMNYEYALSCKPDCAEAHNGLGEALAKQGQYGEAIKHFDEALKINPKYAEAKKNLEAAQATVGKKKSDQ
jgi:tetratricopeptide (TPR) repeat protein